MVSKALIWPTGISAGRGVGAWPVACRRPVTVTVPLGGGGTAGVERASEPAATQPLLTIRTVPSVVTRGDATQKPSALSSGLRRTSNCPSASYVPVALTRRQTFESSTVDP